MERNDKVRIRQKGIALSLVGTGGGLGITLVFRAAGFWRFDTSSFMLLTAVVLGFHGLLWLAPRFGFDRRMERWDPHYVYLPLGAVVVQLGLFV